MTGEAVQHHQGRTGPTPVEVMEPEAVEVQVARGVGGGHRSSLLGPWRPGEPAPEPTWGLGRGGRGAPPPPWPTARDHSATPAEPMLPRRGSATVPPVRPARRWSA